MSMIIFCQADMNMEKYNLKNVCDVGMLYANEIANRLGFTGSVWSNDTFGILYDESHTNMKSYMQKFQATPVFIFLNEILDLCEKIAIFYCEPSEDKSKWCVFQEKQLFLEALECSLLEYEWSTLVYHI